MHYDPIKFSIGNVVRRSVLLRRLFYTVLGLLFLREWHVKRAVRRLLGNRSVAQDVYDAGSGFGQYSYYIARRYPNVKLLSVDVKEEQIDDCRKFFAERGITTCTFAVEDLTKVAHQDRFDIVLSVDVMEHIADDVTVFANFHRALRPGGRLFINTPSDLGGSDAHSPDDASFIEEHARNGYNVQEMRQKLTSVGFEVESIRYTYGPFGSAAWRAGIKWPMLMLNVSKLFFVILPFYYVVALPFVLPLMWLDVAVENRRGTGLNVVAKKN
ncbi:MAG: methyltransferase domain-containing protein [Bacteroidetes bacterium]|jgi:SAM-dependent methyltransferase|nr:methyltransferase domain-containing protein [Bacteroidota bacterium]